MSIIASITGVESRTMERFVSIPNKGLTRRQKSWKISSVSQRDERIVPRCFVFSSNRRPSSIYLGPRYLFVLASEGFQEIKRIMPAPIDTSTCQNSYGNSDVTGIGVVTLFFSEAN